MDLKAGNKEQIILEVAEKLFVEKGFAGTKTTEIADEAGVNHALLHYYFRTKENLFNRIFEQKLSQVLNSFLIVTDDNTSFFDKLKNGIEAHFDFIGKNPKLPLFVLREVVMDKDRRDFMEKHLFPTGKMLYENFKTSIRKEMKKGAIRPVKAMDVLLNIASLNVFAFVAAQMLFDMDAEENREKLQIFLEERKKNNVNLIINSLKY
jgi:AcrR family transcriptional regulator